MRRPIPRPRRYRDNLGILHIDGESFMGRFRNPPMPPRIGLTDASSGAVKVLSHDASVQNVVLADPLPTWSDINTYGPNEGPCRNGWMLWLNNGTLAFKQATGMAGSPILTRRNFDTVVFLIEPSATGAVTQATYDLNSGVEA